MRSLKLKLFYTLLEHIWEYSGVPYVTVHVDTARNNNCLMELPENEPFLVLNLGSNAIRNMECDDQLLSFDTRFSGIHTHCEIPFCAVLAVFDRDNQQVGIQFNLEMDIPAEVPKKATLRVIK